MINFENLDKFTFPGVGKYDIPQIEPVKAYPHGEFIPVNYHYTAKDQASKIVHFFVDDYQFIRYWNTPDKYIPKLLQFAAVCAPDFSTYTDMPLAMQIYNHYRKHWLAAYWQMHGMTVYPTISWSDENSYDWCFDGEPRNAIVSISSHGTQSDPYEAECFAKHCRKALEVLQPSSILWYGKCPAEFDWNVTKIKPFQYERRHYRE